MVKSIEPWSNLTLLELSNNITISKVCSIPPCSIFIDVYIVSIKLLIYNMILQIVHIISEHSVIIPYISKMTDQSYYFALAIKM